MNKKYNRLLLAIILILSGIILIPENLRADERDAFDVTMTPDEKAAVEEWIETSKTMSSEAQAKLQKALDNWRKLQDNFEKCPPELQEFINRVNAAGFTSKINTTIGGLKKFDSGLQSIMDKKEKIDQVIGIYDRYVPDLENPFRSLEVLENMLTDIETYALPKEIKYEYLKNPPVFLIRTAINYFRTGIQNAHGGLKNIQKGIQGRAGNCLGYVGGDEYGDKNDPKRKAYEQINIGEPICYTGVRPVGGEVWKDQTGNLVYVWSSGKWTKLDCGMGAANKVFDYWKLANGTAISSYDLIYWCTGNYVDLFIKAQTKGQLQFKKLTSVDQCQRKILEFLNLDNDFEELMEYDGSNIDLFTAKYIFEKDGVRELGDQIANVVTEIVIFEGKVQDEDGNNISNANVVIEIESEQDVSVNTKSNGSYEIIAEIAGGRYLGLAINIKIKATKYPELEETSRIHSQCMNLGVLKVKNSGQLTIKPISSKIEQGESVDFIALYSDASGNVKDVTSEALQNSKFNAETVGVFTVTANYNDKSAKATVEVIKKECKENEEWSIEKKDCVCKDGFTPNKDKECIKVKDCSKKENEHWDADVGDCICDDGYTKNDKNICESDEEEMDECSLEYIKALTFMLEVLVADTKLSETELLSYINKFNKEINDQSSPPCKNSIIAYCYYSAVEIAARMAENITDIHDIAVEIIMLQAMCPDLNQQMQAEGLTIKSLISSIAGLGAYKDKLNQMEARLRENGCDEDEVEDNGEKIVPPKKDPGFIQEGGISTEMPGDGDDNDGDGQQDEEPEGLAGYNITLVLYDSGSAKDDVFNLSVQGYGNLGQTPAGGLRSYGLNLPPGSYTATVSVVLAPDNVGTYTLTVLYDGESIGSISGSPGQGSSGTLVFTVPSEK